MAAAGGREQTHAENDQSHRELPLVERNDADNGRGLVPLIALDDALNALAAFDLRKSQVVEMRFFGGLSVEETAEALHVSADTVMRDWRLAKVWLVRELSGEQLEGG